MAMKDAIVLYPSPGMGHLISMLELAKLIHAHHPTFSITLIIQSPPLNQSSTAVETSQQIAAATAKRIAAVPSINLHHLPQISLPSACATLSPVQLEFELPRLHLPTINQILQTLSQTSKVKAFVIDFFCDAAFRVSTDLNIPTYYYFTSSAGCLSHFLYFPTEPESNSGDQPVLVPGLPPIPFSDLPEVAQDRTTEIYKKLLETSTHMANSSGVVVNTFELLESRALRAIWDGLCTPEKRTPPPVFPVGPLISTNSDDEGENGQCLSWLNKQPSKSVVFLSFGSMGLFPAKQLTEMAMALESSGHRFLWVVRDPPSEGKEKEQGLDEILPEGFVERTRNRGLVVKRWAPQVAVLSHDSVGGFVTHCGWNSVLEAICGGVPMVAWPLYAEQRLNRVLLVEFKLALPLKESGDGLVSSAELDKRVRELMESERGREVRERILLMRDGAKAAMDSGGTSHVALTKLTQLWKQS
ncbi:UDP-glucuronosyl/UDP-glucosyltransferase [Trema orientale]|uniref:Glycosyltransferase n=1 Tax=Trema orientale TaxID=63057 RepID=A0A2P5FGN8_TREOI|nr:UDP-glucuronosyl/UDP-glucosyltransferase [Trema orientale]